MLSLYTKMTNIIKRINIVKNEKTFIWDGGVIKKIKIVIKLSILASVSSWYLYYFLVFFFDIVWL
jgi:hypothetical protein